MPPRASTPPPRESFPQAVYADVDGTITRYTTIFDFLLFDARLRGVEPEGRAFLASLRERAAAGEPRTATNTHYFTWWAGRAADDVDAVAHAWAEGLGRRDGLFHEGVALRLERARLQGSRLVAVTASFRPALRHVLERLPDLELLCAELETGPDGRYTGAIDAPLVGDAKALRVRAHAEAFGIELARCEAYGDHPSDLPFLRAAGWAWLVGADGELVPVESSAEGAARRVDGRVL
ncbi:HAD-IB family phosphatase [Sinomonas sp. ASV322]|uniref:HAD family hydrolase n=1 Tax=Sinomonas sp. ASV322 TaxID=3041920 RepID=UPI0027DB42DF|nr:HAD-IB family phosphatase [Sinomonas sp. ASV322]MDQ4504042.1 HAD-IB family phosphatase [Sinomonas sp. ASV322]